MGGVLLGFAPFLGFALATGFWGPIIGLLVGAVTSAALVMEKMLATTFVDLVNMAGRLGISTAREA
jgi:hypothetical protein